MWEEGWECVSLTNSRPVRWPRPSGPHWQIVTGDVVSGLGNLAARHAEIGVVVSSVSWLCRCMFTRPRLRWYFLKSVCHCYTSHRLLIYAFSTILPLVTVSVVSSTKRFVTVAAEMNNTLTQRYCSKWASRAWRLLLYTFWVTERMVLAVTTSVWVTPPNSRWSGLTRCYSFWVKESVSYCPNLSYSGLLGVAHELLRLPHLFILLICCSSVEHLLMSCSMIYSWVAHELLIGCSFYSILSKELHIINQIHILRREPIMRLVGLWTLISVINKEKYRILLYSLYSTEPEHNNYLLGKNWEHPFVFLHVLLGDE